MTIKIIRTKPKLKYYIKCSVDLPVLNFIQLYSSFDPVVFNLLNNYL
jgi:hypothetical protein